MGCAPSGLRPRPSKATMCFNDLTKCNVSLFNDLENCTVLGFVPFESPASRKGTQQAISLFTKKSPNIHSDEFLDTAIALVLPAVPPANWLST